MKKLKLYHYSDKKISDKIKVKYFSDNIYTKNDKNISAIKRIFFFCDDNIPEYRFENCKYRYIIEVKEKDIYNLITDKDNLKNKYANNINGLLKYIKNKYQGCIYNVGYDITILFKDIKI